MTNLLSVKSMDLWHARDFSSFYRIHASPSNFKRMLSAWQRILDPLGVCFLNFHQPLPPLRVRMLLEVSLRSPLP